MCRWDGARKRGSKEAQKTKDERTGKDLGQISHRRGARLWIHSLRLGTRRRRRRRRCSATLAQTLDALVLANRIGGTLAATARAVRGDALLH